MTGAIDRLGDIGDTPIAPQADLVPKDPKPPGPTGTDGAFGDDATITTAEVGNRRLLDHVCRLG